MLAKALYTVTINGVEYKKGNEYEIKEQVVISGREYFKLLDVVKNKKQKKVQVLKNNEETIKDSVEKKPVSVSEKVVENFENLEK